MRKKANEYIEYIDRRAFGRVLAIRHSNSAFRAFQFVICLLNTTAAFWRAAYPAFPSIKHEKRQKQHAVFLMLTI